MTFDEFDAALDVLGWKIADFCRATDLHRNTPQRWKREGIEIPSWVPKHLGLLIDLHRLHATYLQRPKHDAGAGTE
ncbi:hypothetical protein [Limnohabitans sp. TS-CS-82]|uniref:hypothetical protein n=1 Tax=Limnohabitans sp. TS-CS-82 TaxID=2094193 RepID=UPI0011AFE618|nr:hypothetical protein [Limnohabitans sp. TS-CS-82]